MADPVRTVKTEPEAASLVPISEVRAHLNLFDDDTYDTYLTQLSVVATSMVGDTIGRSLDLTSVVDYYMMTGDRRLNLSGFEIEGSPTVAYVNQENTSITVGSGDYIIDTSGEKPAIVLNQGLSGLSTDVANPISVSYSSLDSILQDHAAVQQAILLLIGDMFKNRENQSEAQQFNVSVTTDRLLKPHRSNLI